MQPRSTVSYDWNSPSPVFRYHTGVSLHSHTSHSIESLTFIHSMFMTRKWLRPVFSYYEKASRSRHNITLDFVAAHWRPPLVPRMAFDLESQQIRSLGLTPLVSITDHDDIQAPLLLRTISSARHIPVSLEWTVPFGSSEFHVGIHNLPSADCLAWVERLAHFTKHPEPGELSVLLAELDADPRILIVLNHPLWDLYAIGKEAHECELDRLLAEHGRYFHAFELNGLRHARENHEVVLLAKRWKQLLISGGDRHGVEPNANINLTNAETFSEFVREIRVDRRSHILFLEQYKRPWEERMLGSTLDAIVNHGHFTEGWQRWDERAFHPDWDGVLRPLSQLWANGKAPLPLRVAIGLVRLSRFATVSRTMRLLLPRVPVEGLPVANQEIA